MELTVSVRVPPAVAGTIAVASAIGPAAGAGSVCERRSAACACASSWLMLARFALLLRLELGDEAGALRPCLLEVGGDRGRLLSRRVE